MHAFRNLRNCTKDCLCLYVCPTGASDTENGQIDFKKCIACGLCISACPSHAISMVPDTFAPQQRKADAMKQEMMKLIQTIAEQEAAAHELAKHCDDKVFAQLAAALEKSNRIMAEDLFREAGYMLPQSKNTHDFLRSLKAVSDDRFPMEDVDQFLKLLDQND